jgi:protein TonB
MRLPDRRKARRLAEAAAVSLCVTTAIFIAIPLAHRASGAGVRDLLGTGLRKVEVSVAREEKKTERRRKQARSAKARDVDRADRAFLSRFAMDLDVAGVGAGVGTKDGPGIVEFEEGETDTDPQPIRSSLREPVYPARAREAGITGVTVLRFLVDERGTVRKVDVVSEDPPNFGFAAAARDAVMQYRFKAATLQGMPVRIWVQREFQFRL